MNKKNIKELILEIFRSGTIAGIVMIPFGILFASLGLHINEYGRAVINLLFATSSDQTKSILVIVEHFIISWFAAIPLLYLLQKTYKKYLSIAIGLLYGAFFYVMINSLALPWFFGKPTPWELGLTTVYPSLIVHLVYGISIAITSRNLNSS